MAKTQQDLAELVLLELGRADAANPAENSDDIALVKARYADLRLELEDTVFWDLDAIPERVFTPLAQHVAHSLRFAFGKPDYNPVNDEGLTPVQRIRAASHEADVGYPAQVEYF